MENGGSLILKLVSAKRAYLFGKKRTRVATKKRQRKWEEIHLALVDNGYVSPLKPWNYTRTIWYRMVAGAKASLKKYTSGLKNLHQQDRRILDILGIPIVAPVSTIGEKENLIEEEGSQIRIESLELLEDDNELTPVNLTQMSDLELKKALLRQEFRLNEYKLLKMKFFFMKEGNKQIYERSLKQLKI